jgi:hypothetical protein
MPAPESVRAACCARAGGCHGGSELHIHMGKIWRASTEVAVTKLKLSTPVGRLEDGTDQFL